MFGRRTAVTTLLLPSGSIPLCRASGRPWDHSLRTEQHFVEKGQEYRDSRYGQTDRRVECVGAHGPPAPGVEQQTAEGLAAEEGLHLAGEGLVLGIRLG